MLSGGGERMRSLEEMPGLRAQAVRIGLGREVLHLRHFHHVIAVVGSCTENSRWRAPAAAARHRVPAGPRRCRCRSGGCEDAAGRLPVRSTSDMVA